MSGKTFTVLAMDDSLTIRKLIEMAADGESFNLDLAADGQTGIELARDQQPQLILLDYMLPDMKGSDVCAELERDERTRDIPIIVMSAKGQDVVALFDGYRAVSGFLHKPFSSTQLVETLRRAQSGNFEGVAEGHGKRAHANAPRNASAGADKLTRAFYAVLKSALASIPHWESKRRGRSPSSYFARRILTSDRVRGIVSAVGSTGRESVPEGGLTAEQTDSLAEAFSDATMSRCSGFSARVATEPLGATDRKVLMLMDGRRSLGEIREQSGLSSARFLGIVATMARHNLLVPCAPSEASRSSVREEKADPTWRPAMILDADVEGVHRPLAKLLRQRPRPLDLVSINGERDLVGRIRRDSPACVFISEDCAAVDLDEFPKQIHTEDLQHSPRLVALIAADTKRPEKEKRLLDAGFDAVFAKPFDTYLLERVLGRAI